MVRVDPSLEIPDAELTFVTSRSSGPGGQNVNKVDTRVTLLFDVGQTHRIAFLAEHAGNWPLETIGIDWASPRLTRWYTVE